MNKVVWENMIRVGGLLGAVLFMLNACATAPALDSESDSQLTQTNVHGADSPADNLDKNPTEAFVHDYIEPGQKQDPGIEDDSEVEVQPDQSVTENTSDGVDSDEQDNPEIVLNETCKSLKKVLICHHDDNHSKKFLCVPEQAVPAHLKHGDVTGVCGAEK